MSITVYCIESKKIYPSIKEAAKSIGISKRTLYNYMNDPKNPPPYTKFHDLTFMKAYGWRVTSWCAYPESTVRYPEPKDIDPDQLMLHCWKALKCQEFVLKGLDEQRNEDPSSTVVADNLPVCAFCVRRNTRHPCKGRIMRRSVSLDTWREANNNNDADSLLLNIRLRKMPFDRHAGDFLVQADWFNYDYSDYEVSDDQLHEYMS